MSLILVLYVLNLFLLMFIAMREVRRPANTVLWLLIGLILPFVGFMFYLITSNPKSIPHKKRLTYNESSFNNREIPSSFSPSIIEISTALQQLSVGGLKVGQIQMLTNGIETYERLLKSIKKAKKSIDFEYYIYRNDDIGKKIVNALIQKAGEGVKIRFLIDGWGSRKFPEQAKNQLRKAGIEFRSMFPLRFPWILSTLNYRDHCKIVVIDGNEAFTGGINVGDEYTGLDQKVGFWRDTHVRILGGACCDLEAIFSSHWSIAAPEKIRNTRQTTQIRTPFPSISETLVTEFGSEYGSETEQDISKLPPTAYIHTIEGNPEIPTQTIRQAFFLCLTQAKDSIDITTPYFVPDVDIITALKTTVARGVRVRLLVPLKTDEKVVGLASKTFYGEILEAGVEVYQYCKGILHSKVMVIDQEMVEVGAANFDKRSFQLNYEVCQFVYSKEVAKLFSNQFEEDIKVSVPLRVEELAKRTRLERIQEQAARLISPLL